MRSDQDTGNSFYQGLNDKAASLYSQAASATAYIEPEILAIQEDKLHQFILEKKSLSFTPMQLKKLQNSVRTC